MFVDAAIRIFFVRFKWKGKQSIKMEHISKNHKNIKYRNKKQFFQLMYFFKKGKM